MYFTKSEQDCTTFCMLVNIVLKISPCDTNGLLRHGFKWLLWHNVSCVLCLATQLCPALCDPMHCSRPGSPVHGDSPGKSTGVGCHALLRGIFPTQGSNPGLLHCRQILYQLSHQGSPLFLGSFPKLTLCLQALPSDF